MLNVDDSRIVASRWIEARFPGGAIVAEVDRRFGQLVRQLLTESAALGVAGGVIGLLSTVWLVPVLARLLNVPASLDFSPDPIVFSSSPACRSPPASVRGWCRCDRRYASTSPQR